MMCGLPSALSSPIVEILSHSQERYKGIRSGDGWEEPGLNKDRPMIFHDVVTLDALPQGQLFT